ncbi:Two pore potassium channel b [Dichanthelium oligosanthes]|uniref:Two pore potassium channel b n=1 Tax=Dichanthelium oligosanthes TaxID=888268 RepID=A0A1E5VH08_9POAL|nr:Two pore potassium channel b [Dichanthelium oligosanthes]
MAENGVKQPLLQDGDPPNAGLTKPPQGAGKKRFRRCRTAPSSDPAQDSPPPSQNSSQERAGASSPPFAPSKELLRGARPSFRLVGVLLLAYHLAGTIAFYLAMDHMSGDRTRSRVVDALYFCVVTMTTVGYGDLVPASDSAKLLACAFVFAGVALVGTFLSKAADYLVEKQEMLLFRAIHLRRADDRRALRAMEANKVRYKLYTSAALLAATLASGTAFLVKVEGMRPVDAFYCVCATVTTLGYGDRSFSSVPGRAFAAAWIMVSTVVVALFFLYAAELAAERRQRELARWVLKRRTTCADLEAADMDGDHRVGAADFVLYKLKEMGKISQDEIAEFLEEFDELDADNSGSLSPHDLLVAQPG